MAGGVEANGREGRSPCGPGVGVGTCEVFHPGDGCKGGRGQPASVDLPVHDEGWEPRAVRCDH